MESSSEQLRRGFPLEVSTRQELLIGFACPSQLQPARAWLFPTSSEGRALEQELSHRKQLMVKLGQRCWAEVLARGSAFSEVQVVFLNHCLWGVSLCCGKGQGKAIEPL